MKSSKMYWGKQKRTYQAADEFDNLDGGIYDIKSLLTFKKELRELTL